MLKIYPKVSPNYNLPQILETASKCLNCTVSAKKAKGFGVQKVLAKL